ncbi:MAG TPA: hypothetical protein V6D35_06180 [Candidatus Sericytochromatia bacterium]
MLCSSCLRDLLKAAALRDRTILLAVHSPKAEAAREAIAPYFVKLQHH